MRSVFKWLAVAVVAALVLSYPTLAPNPYLLSVGVVILNYAVLATSWNFVGGFTGYMSLGHGALFGLGGSTLLVASAAATPFGHAVHTESARSARVFVRSDESVLAASAAETRGTSSAQVTE